MAIIMGLLMTVPSIRVEASVTSEVRDRLSAYEEWYCGHEKKDYYYKCPMKNVDFNEIYDYVQDMYSRLDGSMYHEIFLTFEYTPKSRVGSLDDFGDDFAFPAEKGLQHSFADKSVFKWLGVSAGTQYEDGKIVSHRLRVYFTNCSVDYLKNKKAYKNFIKKAETIVDNGK